MKTLLLILFVSMALISINTRSGDLAPPEFSVSQKSEDKHGYQALIANQKDNIIYSRNQEKINKSATYKAENEIIVFQSGNYNIAIGLQTGIGNFAALSQINGGNRMELDQRGDRNSVSLQQSGKNQASLEQSGISHRAEIMQAPGGPPISIKQTGIDGFVRVTQY